MPARRTSSGTRHHMTDPVTLAGEHRIGEFDE
jgi:hypothetical protein